MDDKNIVAYYTNRVVHNWNSIPEEHKLYIAERFNDSQSIKESIWRILYHIEERPVCEVCGGAVKFVGRKHMIFSKTCSKDCFRKLLNKPKDEYYDSLSTYDKTKYTCLKRYGVDHPSKLSTNVFKCNNPQKNDIIKQKTKQTRIELYGQYMSDANISSLQSIDTKHKRCQSFNTTMLNKYGDNNYRNTNKHKETCIEKYGVDSYFKTDEFKNLMIKNKSAIQQKIYNAKVNHKSFNTSKPENESYTILKEHYPDVVSQYKDNRYPFACDFYIPSIDLFIECNYHWTHGGKPYEGTEDDKQIVEKWKTKGTKFYNNAIQTWTIRDVNKRNIAKQNKLNYIEFWAIKELTNWLNNQT